MKTIKHLIPLFIIMLLSFGAFAQVGAVQNTSSTAASPQSNLQIHHGKRMLQHMRNGKRHEWRMRHHQRHTPADRPVRGRPMEHKK